MGIILKNEAKTEDMVAILKHIADYVPTVRASRIKNISTGEQVQVDASKMHSILVGGDQMTAARARAAKETQLNGQTSFKRLDGIIPVLEDWHTKGNFMGVSCFKSCYCTSMTLIKYM